MSLDRREAANASISAAMAILNTILYEADIRNAVVGAPLFLHTMVAFSSVFLMKVAWKWNWASLYIDQVQIQHLVTSIIDLLSKAKASENHLTYYIASGLRKMLEQLTRPAGLETSPTASSKEGIQRGGVPSSEAPFYDTGFNFFDNYGLDFDSTWGAAAPNFVEF